jgi:hypothetical protein
MTTDQQQLLKDGGRAVVICLVIAPTLGLSGPLVAAAGLMNTVAIMSWIQRRRRSLLEEANEQLMFGE